MSFTNFTIQQTIAFILSIAVIILSVIVFRSGKTKGGIILLFTGTLMLGFFICSLDHFLILWDEQFHALVAKNMMADPLKPTLYITPVLEYDYKNWTFNHVWLHKQPLFLWQMALSLKLFGISALSVRIPGIIMHALATVMIYRIGKISVNANAGFYGALFFCVASYPLELIAGRHATDHNDIAFLFYMTGSFWAWFEYQNSGKAYWIIVIGLFAGCAVLVKWLVGLMVYGIWVISIGIGNKKNWLKVRLYFPVLIAFAVSLVVFLPWQLYILSHYPQEASYEYQYNTSHFFEALEDHGGDIWFHFNALKEIYGTALIIPFLLLAGLFILIRNSRKSIYRMGLLLPVVIVYGFFTIAATKMTSFCLIACPFIFLGLGALTDSVINLVISKIKFPIIGKLLCPLLLIAIGIYFIDFPRIVNYHTELNPQGHCTREEEMGQMDFIKKLQGIVGNEQYVVFNTGVKPKGNIPTMFYTNCIAYEYIPDENQIRDVKGQRYKIAILVKDSIPDFIARDNDILKIDP